MIAYLDKPSQKQVQKILCFYYNTSNNLKILRLNNSWEKVVFPGEKLFFEGLAKTQLEIKQPGENGEAIRKTISCDRLQVRETN